MIRTNQKIILTIVLGANFILASCSNTSPTLENEAEIAPASKFAEATPQPDFSVPDGWALFPKPKAESQEIQCANGAIKNEWKVEAENGRLTVSKYVYKDDEQLTKLPTSFKEQILKNRNIGKGLGGYLHVEPYESGWLIGSDAGEWGGKLSWFSADGSQKKELLNDNVRGIVRVGDKILILSGMAHLTIDEGKIYKLIKAENGGLSIQLMIDLKTQPQNFVVENNNSALVTLNSKILRIKSSAEIETLKEVHFNSLYPNSMAVTASGVIYIGMRLFMVRLVPNESGYAEEWLVKQNCQKFIQKDFDCVCAGK